MGSSQKFSNRLNILFFHNRPSGGAGESLYQVVRHSNGWKPVIVFISKGGFLKEKFEQLKPKPTIYYWSASSWLAAWREKSWAYLPTQLYHLSRTIRFIRKLYRLVKAEKIDVIHTNTMVLIQGGIVAWLCKIPHYIQIRELIDLDYYQYPISKKWILRIISLFSTKLIANSERTKQALLKFGVKEKNIEIIYNMVSSPQHNYDIRERLNLPANTKTVAIVGWITPNKKVEDFIDVAAHFIDQKEIKFLIIGGWGYREDYNQLIKTKLQQTPNIITTGIIENAPEYLGSIDLLLCPCYTESFGRTVGEALAAGTPAIGVNSCAVAEIIDHDKTGYLVNKSDISGFVKYTRHLLANPDLRATMGKTGITTMQKKFGSLKISKDYYSLYHNSVE